MASSGSGAERGKQNHNSPIYRGLRYGVLGATMPSFLVTRFLHSLPLQQIMTPLKWEVKQFLDRLRGFHCADTIRSYSSQSRNQLRP